MQNTLILTILSIGWPVLIVSSILIIKKGISYSKKLKKTAAGKLMKPTIYGWMFGLYATSIVSTAYMLSTPWYYSVIPIFFIFLVVIAVIYRTMISWEKEAIKIHKFYEKLEVLVEERTEKLKDQFVFIAAHELRTPVTAISWNIESALEKDNKLSPELKEMLEDVQSSNSRLITLVNDLLNVARIESGTIKIVPAEIELSSIIKKTIAEMKSIFSKKHITVQYSPQKHTVWADPERLKQVVINLLSNATKYNKNKGTIKIKVNKEKLMLIVL